MSLGWHLPRYEDGDKEDVSFPELSEMLVRREDELQSDGKAAAAAQDAEAKDNGGKGGDEDGDEDEDKKKGEGAEEDAEDKGKEEEEEKPRVALPRPVFPNLVRTPTNPILRKWPFAERRGTLKWR